MLTTSLERTHEGVINIMSIFFFRIPLQICYLHWSAANIHLIYLTTTHTNWITHFLMLVCYWCRYWQNTRENKWSIRGHHGDVEPHFSYTEPACRIEVILCVPDIRDQSILSLFAWTSPALQRIHLPANNWSSHGLPQVKEECGILMKVYGN